MASPIKTVVQQGQYPVQGSASLVSSGSPFNILPETPVKPGPGSLKMALPDPSRASSSSSSLSSCVTSSKIKSQLKSPPFITPPVIHPTAASNQEILRDVADMKEDLIRMTAILQTDTRTAAKTVQTSHTGTPKETKLEDEETFTLVEKVKEDLVKVSEILQKDILSEGKAMTAKERTSEDEWEEFSKDEIEEAQRSALSEYHPPFDESTLPFKPHSMPSKDFDLAKVVDYLANDIGASSLSKMAEVKCRYEEEAKREGEEKQKRVLKPAMSLQEHKLKMPPPGSGMRTSPSEKDLSKLAESYQGTDTILESPEDLSHEQDKSPLSDSGFETRSEKTPSAPQSAESTGPKPLFADSPIPPCVTETRTEVVHIRSYEQPDEPCEPVLMEEAASAIPCIEPDAASPSSIKDKVKALQLKMSEEDSMVSKSMCLKEETHITTTTRMVYHKPQLTDGAERIEEGMSVRDIMKAFQSGRDPSKELAGLFEHKAGQDSVKGDELTPRFLDKDVKSKPKVERIIEVHIEKGHSTAEPTEVIIRETKKHPELYVYKGDRGIKELTDYDEAQQEEEELTAEESLPSFLETSRVNTPVSQEEDSRPSSAQLIADDSYKALKLLSQHSIEYCDDELSDIRGESYRFAEKMLLSEKLDTSSLSHSDTEDSAMMTDQNRHLTSEESGGRSTESISQQRGSPKKEFIFKSKDGSPKSGKFSLHRDEQSQFDKVTVLHYSTEQGSPKHAVWMRFTEDKHDRSRDKLLYEDRVDQTVKEAEEKLSEVSQFFRDKTEKLNDELQSPEKKPVRREPRETRSGPSSTCSSPEKTQQKPKAGGEVWGKSKLREPSVGKMFGTTTATEKKSSSLPSSPERSVFSRLSEDKIKQTKTNNAPKDSNSNNLPSPRETLEKVLAPPVATTTKENFKGIKTLPVYVSVQVGRQAEREARGTVYTVKQKSSSALSPISPDDDTLEQVSFIDSSGKSPLTPETPSSEEVSYDLTSRTPDGFMGFMTGKPSPIMEVSEESEEDDGKTSFSFKEALPERPSKQEQQAVSKDKGVAYIEFPPPPPLDSASEQSDTERKGSCASSETETEMMEVNLQEEHDKHLLTEPIIRIQPPSPVPPGTDDSQSNAEEDEDEESIFQPIPCKKFTFKVPEEEEEEEKKEKEKGSKSKKHDKNGNNKESNGGTNGSNGSNGSKGSNGKGGEDYEYEQNGNDQSITDCSIATTAEFSHDTDATEIDSLDGYELQDEDDGLCEQADLRLFGLPDSRRDVWASDTFRSPDRSFPQTKLEVIEEEKTPEECQKATSKNDSPLDGGKLEGVCKDGVQNQEQKPSDKEGFSDTYFSYKLEEEFNSPFKTVATKGLDFDPWPSKGGEDEVVDMAGTRDSNGEPKPFGLAVDDQSQATTPDTTPARTPTDDSTPTSEPNPFPFHEGKMFEMTRSGAIDMSKRDMVEERLQFFQIGEHYHSAGRYSVRASEQNSNPQTGNSNNNSNNLDSHNIHANFIHPGSIVFNLLSSSEPTLQQVSRVEAAFSQLEENSREEPSRTSRASRSSRPSPTSTSTSTTITTPTRSARGVRAEVEQADSERMRRSRRKSRRTLGGKEQKEKEEGSQVDQPITAPVTENETSL
ncbi:ankyrin-3-like [Centroberyx gerrardi]